MVRADLRQRTGSWRKTGRTKASFEPRGPKFGFVVIPTAAIYHNFRRECRRKINFDREKKNNHEQDHADRQPYARSGDALHAERRHGLLVFDRGFAAVCKCGWGDPTRGCLAEYATELDKL